MSTSKKIVLRSSDDETFEIEEAVAMKSQTIKGMIEDGCAENVIPLLNVTGKILSKVIEYCKKHVEEEETADAELKSFDSQFLTVDMNTLYDLVMAANFLNIKGLLDRTCEKVADMLKGKTPEQMRKVLNIKNDLSEEEEAKIRSDNAWAFE